MSYARYYVMPRSSQATELSFTAGQRWVQVAIRGVDSGGNAIKKPFLEVQQGGGTFHLTAGCVYEMYFSDHIIKEEELDGLKAPGQHSLQGDGIVFSTSLDNIAFWPSLRHVASSAVQDPPPPPPPYVPSEPFDIRTIYR
ncbi:MAG TPA: hypothetical protein VL242_38590 [Sorangium sp.]|nr:hypothetical protein [Sorangium sp.]